MRSGAGFQRFSYRQSVTAAETNPVLDGKLAHSLFRHAEPAGNLGLRQAVAGKLAQLFGVAQRGVVL